VGCMSALVPESMRQRRLGGQISLTINPDGFPRRKAIWSKRSLSSRHTQLLLQIVTANLCCNSSHVVSDVLLRL